MEYNAKFDAGWVEYRFKSFFQTYWQVALGSALALVQEFGRTALHKSPPDILK